MIDKGAVAGLIFVMALAGGLPPLFVTLTPSRASFLAFCDSLARGIFLGIGCLHLFVDAVLQFEALGVPAALPLTLAVTFLAFGIIHWGERYAYDWFAAEHLNVLPAYTLMLLLSLHSIIAGATLGFAVHDMQFYMLTLAIMSHKSAAAFALGTRINQAPFTLLRRVALILLFAVMTPFGLWVGQHSLLVLEQPVLQTSVAAFNAVAAGTFIYIAFALRSEALLRVVGSTIAHRLCFFLGAAIMAMSAILI